MTDPGEDPSEEPEYRDPSEIHQTQLGEALNSLSMLGDDPYLRMQAFNLSVVDHFIMGLEYRVLARLMDEERTPLDDAVFLSAQSQMWLFAIYELLRTWRERAKDVIKWNDNGVLRNKIEALADSGANRPPTRDDVARLFRNDLARDSGMMSPTIPE